MGGHVREISGTAVDSELRAAKDALVVIDWYATWCGPCKMIAPFVESLAAKHPDVVFLKVCEGEDSREVMMAKGVQAFPTFHFYISGSKVHEIRGASQGPLEKAVETYKAQAKPAAAAFSGAGMSLGGSGARPDDIRAARLARLGASAAVTSPTNSASAAAPAPAPAPAPASTPAAAPKPAAAASSSSGALPPGSLMIVSELTEMGFDTREAAAAVRATGGSGGVEAAIEWLESHQSQAAVEAVAAAPAHAPAQTVTASGSAEGRDPFNVEVAGASSGSGDAGASAAPAPASGSSADGISDEDRAAIAAAEAELNGEGADSDSAGGGAGGKKMTEEELRVFLAARRAEKARAAEEDARARELKRRTDGQKAIEMAEELAAMSRKREADKRKAEAEATRRELNRQRLELLKDKAERYTKRGEAVPAELAAQITTAARVYAGLPDPNAEVAPKPATAQQAMELAVKAIAAFRTNDARGTAAATLKTLVKNVLEKPSESKFRTVNLANERIRERLAAVTGSLQFLRAAGWIKDDGEQTMTLSDSARDEGVLRIALQVLETAQAPGGVLTT